MFLGNIVLIGFMGSGKSTVGRLFAKETEGFFLDTDAMIESAEGRSIEAIFAKEGEAYFRALEAKTVKWMSENVKHAVISAGGGMLVYCEALKEIGTVVYLKVPFATIKERLSEAEAAKRPLFKDFKQAKAMYEARQEIYEARADIIVDANKDTSAVLKELKEALGVLS